MNRYSNYEILDLFYIHGECDRIISRTCRAFNEKYPHLPSMTEKIFRKYVSNFQSFGCVRAPKEYKRRVVDDEENEISVLTYFEANENASIRSAAHEIDLDRNSVHRILKKHNMHDYKYEKVHALEPGDYIKRLNFCRGILEKLENDENFLKKIIWTDEAKFNNEGLFNRKNCHIWRSENPHRKRQRNPQNKFSFNVFALLMNNKVRYYIYEENLNTEKFLEILRNFVSEFLDELPLSMSTTAYYQLDGAPAHSSHEVSEELNAMFGNRWIGRRSSLFWPPRSPDLTPLDFYLWGRIKNIVYESPIESKEDLKRRVEDAFHSLKGEEIERATNRGVSRRIRKCVEQNGYHIETLT